MKGGTSTLKQLLLDLKKYSFSGYVRTVRADRPGRSEGVVLLRLGNPEASVHQKGSQRAKGRAALKQVWQDSYDEGCVIELHARVDMEGLVKEYADAVLERPARVVRKPKVPQPVARSEAEVAIAEWRVAGYEVSSVERLLNGDPQALTIPFLSLREAIGHAKTMLTALDQLDVTGFEERAATLRARLMDPLSHPDLDMEFESIREAIDGRRQTDARRVFEEGRGRDSDERAKKVVQIVMKHKPPVPGEASPSSAEIKEAVEGPALDKDPETNLVREYSFDTFAVGSSNRFAQAGAVAAAKLTDTAYNPLLVVAGPGLGKTHLLHAIGNLRRGIGKDAKVLYMTAESLSREFESARSSDSLATFRTRLRQLDCLLLDDIQLLGAKAEVQEELYQAFTEFRAANRQVVLASDRPPKAIPDLDGRLASCIESGLVVDVQAPDRETRIAILEKRVHGTKLDVETEALGLIAELVDDNIRELVGSFNRVVAFSALMDRPITRELAQEVLREGGGELGEDARIGLEEAAKELSQGRSYLVEEARPVAAFRLFAKALSTSHGGLVITRTNPKRVRESFAITADRILWLTDRDSTTEKTIQPILERMIYEIDDFFAKRPGGALLIDGLEYLVSNNSFEAVLKFVRRLVDTVSEGRSIFIISLGPGTLKDQELKMLEREMEILRFG